MKRTMGSVLVFWLGIVSSNVVFFFLGSYSIYENQNETTRVDDFARCVSFLGERRDVDDRGTDDRFLLAVLHDPAT